MNLQANPAAALDGGSPVLFAFLATWPAASEPQCSEAALAFPLPNSLHGRWD